MMVRVVWSTKNRKPLIRNELIIALLDHIRINGKQKGIFIDTLNCVADHIYLLISLGSEQTVSKIVQLLKGESSLWVNEQNTLTDRFE
jgi:putative transposase